MRHKNESFPFCTNSSDINHTALLHNVSWHPKFEFGSINNSASHLLTKKKIMQLYIATILAIVAHSFSLPNSQSRQRRDPFCSAMNGQSCDPNIDLPCCTNGKTLAICDNNIFNVTACTSTRPLCEVFSPGDHSRCAEVPGPWEADENLRVIIRLCWIFDRIAIKD